MRKGLWCQVAAEGRWGRVAFPLLSFPFPLCPGLNRFSVSVITTPSCNCPLLYLLGISLFSFLLSDTHTFHYWFWARSSLSQWDALPWLQGMESSAALSEVMEVHWSGEGAGGLQNYTVAWTVRQIKWECIMKRRLMEADLLWKTFSNNTTNNRQWLYSCRHCAEHLAYRGSEVNNLQRT